MTAHEILMKQRMAEAQMSRLQQQAYNNPFYGAFGGLGGQAAGFQQSAFSAEHLRQARQKMEETLRQPKPKAHDSVIQLTKQPDGSFSVPLTLTQEVS